MVGGGEERVGKTSPDVVGVEGEHEFYGAAGQERGEDGVDGAVDVVEWEKVEEAIFRGVLPGFEEGY